METKETAIMTAQSGYMALKDTASIAEAYAECDGLEFTLDKVKMPGGGATAFEIPGEGDEPELSKELRGIIVHNHPAYSYYREKYTGGSNPPDCGSFDGKVGIGYPGGRCAECYYNKFGTGDGQSKACKNRRILYVLQEGELFPVMLSLPTGSLKEFSQYAKRQLSKGRKLSDVVTKISLRKATSATGILYSQAVFTMERIVTHEEKAAIQHVISDAKSYAEHLSMAALVPTDESAPDNGEEVVPLN